VMGGYRVDIYNYAVGALVVGIAAITMGVLPRQSLAFAMAPALNSAATIAQLHGWHYQVVPVIASTYLFYLYVLALAWAPPGRFGQIRKIAALGIAALLVPLCARQIMSSPWLYPKEKHLLAAEVVNPRDAGNYLASHTQSTDRVLYYGGNPIAPYVAKRLPATPYIVMWMLNFSQSLPEQPDLDSSHKPTEKQKSRILALQAQVQGDACNRVMSQHPAALVFENGPGFNVDPLVDFTSFCPAFGALVNTEYHLGSAFGDSRVYLRNDRQ